MPIYAGETPVRQFGCRDFSHFLWLPGQPEQSTETLIVSCEAPVNQAARCIRCDPRLAVSLAAASAFGSPL